MDEGFIKMKSKKSKSHRFHLKILKF